MLNEFRLPSGFNDTFHYAFSRFRVTVGYKYMRTFTCQRFTMGFSHAHRSTCYQCDFSEYPSQISLPSFHEQI